MSEAVTISKKKLTIRIELHRNGVTVEAHVPSKGGDGPEDYESNQLSYVYKTIDEMVKELPSFISVLKEKAGVNSDNPTKNEPDLGNSKEKD